MGLFVTIFSIFVAIFAIIAFNYYANKVAELCVDVITDVKSRFSPVYLLKKTDIQDIFKEFSDLIRKVRLISHFKFLLTSESNYDIFSNLLSLFDSLDSLLDWNNRIFAAVTVVNKNLANSNKRLKDVSRSDLYQSHHLMEKLKSHCLPIASAVELLTKENALSYLKNPKNAEKFCRLFNECVMGVDNHNDECIKLLINRNADFFDSVGSHPLDMQQREAVVVDEDNTLVISSAGSGKTTTIVAKVHYLVEVLNIKPEEIMLLTYTRKAAEELSSRIKLNGLISSTFHQVALSIIADRTGSKPTICEPSLMLNCFYDLLHSDHKFIKAIFDFVFIKRSFGRYRHDYTTSYEYYSDRRKYGVQATYKDMNGRIPFTKSEEEKSICDWLALHNIEFLYEEPYEINVSDHEKRQYKPDFSIFFTNNAGDRKRIYLEHYAIDKDGNVPSWFSSDYDNSDMSDEALLGRWEEANRKYHEGIEWKYRLHKENGTVLIYTTSAMFYDDTFENELTRQLSENGLTIRPLSDKEMLDKLVNRSKSLEKSIYRLIEQFIVLRKSNLISFDSLFRNAYKEEDYRSVMMLNSIMKPFSDYYEERLRDLSQIDFTDAIIKATELSKEHITHRFKYILVDEFQDISKDRYLFLKSLRSEDGDRFTKMFCVGDDWQSIYRFSGSDMSLFYDFSKYFGYTRNCKIETTYRFHNPLIRYSSAFIQANPHQVKKNIRDNVTDGTKSTDLFFRSYTDDSDELEQIRTLVSKIPIDKSILIIGRYNYNCCSLGYDFDYKKTDKSRIVLDIAGRKVSYMSVHSSKGLEADYVILINCNSGINGFPSLIEDDNILSFVLSDKDTFEYAEERRLFYVAITRSKVATYVFYQNDIPSCFVDEFLTGVRSMSNSHIRCPKCGIGHIHVVKKGFSDYYGDWVLLGCTNRASLCDYSKIMKLKDYENMLDSYTDKDDSSEVMENIRHAYTRLKLLLSARKFQP